MRALIRPAGFALALALATACGTDGTSNQPRKLSGASPAPRTFEPEGPREDATVNSLPEETREWMKAALHEFSAGNPSWSGLRAEWLAMGEREANFLVAVMWGGLLRAQKLAAGELVERARHELALIGEPSIGLMSGIVGGGTAFSFYDDIEEEEKVVPIDDTARREAAEVLTIIGPPAVASLVHLTDNAETKSGRKFALKSLGDMGDGGGPDATSALTQALDNPDWIVRVEAAHALRTRSDESSRQALEGALGDDERLVRQKAADALAARGEAASMDALQAAWESARQAGRLAEASRLNRSVKLLEQVLERRRR
jgi:HEAT repeat protein